MKAEEARCAARGLQADERVRLREAGKKKLEEYRRKKQLGAALGVQPQHINLLTSLCHKPSIQVTNKEPPANKGVYSPPPKPESPVVEEDNPDSPLIDMLLLQVNQLMQEKRGLQQDNDQLRRENEQLSELVGYLTLQLEGEEAEDTTIYEEGYLEEAEDSDEYQGSY